MAATSDLYRTGGTSGNEIVHKESGLVLGFFSDPAVADLVVRALDVYNPDGDPGPEAHRVGRSLGTTVYRLTGEAASKSDVMLGYMIARRDADLVVAALNQYRPDETTMKE